MSKIILQRAAEVEKIKTPLDELRRRARMVGVVYASRGRPVRSSLFPVAFQRATFGFRGVAQPG